MSTASWIYLGVLVIGVILFVFYYRTGKFLKCLLFSAFTGLAALGVVWLIGRFTALQFAITPLTLLVSGLMGIPGVVGMLILQLI